MPVGPAGRVTAALSCFAYSVAVVNRLVSPAVSRRALVGFAAGAGAAFASGRPAAAACRRFRPARPLLLRPARLAAGDVVGLVDPASATWEPIDVDIVEDTLTALGWSPSAARTCSIAVAARRQRSRPRRRRDGDVHGSSVKAVLPCAAAGGASGSPASRLRRHQAETQGLMGYSDLTALLLAIHARTGLVTFHGPNGASGGTRPRPTSPASCSRPRR